MRGNENAFPVSTIDNYTQMGMTKREYFALHICSGIRASMTTGHAMYEETARRAVDQADYLLDMLDRT